jgi:hypothetical protein
MRKAHHPVAMRRPAVVAEIVEGERQDRAVPEAGGEAVAVGRDREGGDLRGAVRGGEDGFAAVAVPDGDAAVLPAGRQPAAGQVRYGGDVAVVAASARPSGSRDQLPIRLWPGSRRARLRS